MSQPIRTLMVTVRPQGTGVACTWLRRPLAPCALVPVRLRALTAALCLCQIGLAAQQWGAV